MNKNKEDEIYEQEIYEQEILDMYNLSIVDVEFDDSIEADTWPYGKVSNKRLNEYINKEYYKLDAEHIERIKKMREL